MIRIFISLLLLGSCFITSYGQAPETTLKRKTFQLEAKAYYGFIIPHHEEINSVIKDHVKAVSLNYERPTFGDRSWERLYNYPVWGISFYAAHLGNPEELGFAAGVFPYMNFVISRKYSFRMYYRLGTGVGYISKPFNIESNQKNIAISTRLNSVISTGFECEWQLRRKIVFNIGASLHHFSNSAMRMPNLGINIPAVNSGFTYIIGEMHKVTRTFPQTTIATNYEINLITFGGFREIRPIGGKKYLFFNTGLEFIRYNSRKHRWALGLDVFYSPAVVDRVKQLDEDAVVSKRALRIGLNVGHHITIHRLSIVLQSGMYVIDPYKIDGAFYQRIALRYQLSDRTVGHFGLRTHFAKADNLEVGFGFQLFKHEE